MSNEKKKKKMQICKRFYIGSGKISLRKASHSGSQRRKPAWKC